MPRMMAADPQVVLRHGESRFEDEFNARDVWVFAVEGRYFMHYDAAGPRGWLVASATSQDGVTWKKHGPVLALGNAGATDSASASYGTTFYDGTRWHMFYLGTPNVTADELKTPSFPYMTLHATADSPEGPWRKLPSELLFKPEPGTWYSHTASPGQVLRRGDEYMMLFSASTVTSGGQILRGLGLARTTALDGPWKVDPEPLIPVEEQVENASLYFEPSNGHWFLFTNHITSGDGSLSVPPQRSSEYTDAVWMYWSTDPTRFNTTQKAIVVDAASAGWSPRVIGLPSVLRIGDRLAIYYDGCAEDTIGHGGRDIAVAWLPLPLQPPT